MRLPVKGRFQVWVDGETLIPEGQTLRIARPERVNAELVLRVEPEPGCTGGAVFTGPVTYTTGPGRICLGDWQDQGLGSYSGGVRYQTTFSLDHLPDRLHLDLGKVRGTAEVWVNGQHVGVSLWSPYVFDVREWLRVGDNSLELLVLNTLAPYLDAISPTHFVRPGQLVSGLMGPVVLRG
jgi:hypothetical protein